jgi:uncharacterized protein (DUF1800 family)
MTDADSLVGLEPYSGPWGFNEAAHLLRRTLFGVTKADIDAVTALSMSDAVDALLENTPAPPTPKSVSNQVEVEWVNGAFDSSKENTYQTYLLSWWIDLMLRQGRTLTEKMTLFWHNHFANGSLSVKDARYMYRQNALFRANAFGNFRTLVRDVTLDPAMLRYLNGSTNVKGTPNENYARELQELFTIGKGPERAPGDYTNYTEGDIKEAARILTGWRDDQTTINAKFTSGNHDSGNKTFSANYGGKTITGGSSESVARRELDDLLDMIFEQEATATYICRKLYRFFVDYIVDPAVETEVVTAMATILRANNFDVKPVLSALFKSAHFYSGGRIGCMIKTPTDLLLGTVRTFTWLNDAEHETLYPATTAKRNWAYRTLRRQMATMGMDLMNPPNVAGWPEYWQGPTYHELWINADTLQKRINFLNDVSFNGLLLDEAYYKSWIDVIEFAKRTSKPSDPAILINEAAGMLFAAELTDTQKATLKDILLPGLPDYEWALEWNDYIDLPDDVTRRKRIEDKLRELFKYMLAMAEYQLS